MLAPPLGAYAAGSVFILDPVFGKSGNLIGVDARDGLGKLKACKAKVSRQQIRIRVCQPFQDHNCCRSTEIDDARAARMPAAIRKGAADSIETGPIFGTIQSPEPRH